MAEDLDITEVAYTKLQIDQQRIDDDAARDLLLNAKVSVQTLGSPTGTARLGADGRHEPIEIPFTNIVEIDDVENVTTVINPKRLHYIINKDTVSASAIGAPNGVAPLDSNSLIPYENLPAIPISKVYVVETFQELLDMAAIINEGDRGIVTLDLDPAKNGEWVAKKDNPSLASDWDLLPNLSAVQSVNGLTGDVVINSITESAANAINIASNTANISLLIDEVEPNTAAVVELQAASVYSNAAGTDVDLILDNGIYICDTNLPEVFTEAIVRVINSGFDQTITQEASDYAVNDTFWFRRSDDLGVTWGPWVEQLASITSSISTLEAKQADREFLAIEPTGFDLRDNDYHGIMEMCPLASAGNYWRVDEHNVFTHITGATTFGDGVTPLADRTFLHRPSITHGEIWFWSDGVKFVKTTPQTILLSNVSTKQIIVYDTSGELMLETIVHDAISVNTIVCVITGNPSLQQKVVFANERHGLDMSGATHEMLHETFGAQWGTGLQVSGLANNGNTFISVSAGVIWDEDLKHSVGAVLDAPFIYRDVNGDWALETIGSVVTSTNDLAFVNGGAADALYNRDNGDGTWSLVDTGADYVIMHMFATNDAEFPIFKVVGQNLYADRDAARRNLDGEVTFLAEGELPTPEFLHLCSYILDGTGAIETGLDGEIYVDFRHGYPVSRF